MEVGRSVWQDRHGLGLRLYERGLHEAARQEWRAAYADARHEDSAEGIMRSLSGLAAASLMVGDRFAGYHHAALAEHVAESYGPDHELALNAAVNMQMALSLLGLFGEARRHAEIWLPRFEAVGGEGLGEFVHLCATLALESGRPEEAMQLAKMANELSPERPYNRVVVAQTLAMAEVAVGDVERGAVLLRDCYAAFREVGDPGDCMLSATEVARLEMSRRRYRDAGEWLDLAVAHLLSSPAALDGLELGRLLALGGHIARVVGRNELGGQLLDQGADVLFANGRIQEAEEAVERQRGPLALEATRPADVPRSLAALERLVELGVPRRALFCLQPLSPIGSAAHLLAAELYPGVDVSAVEKAAVLGPFDGRVETILRMVESGTADAGAPEAKVYSVLREYTSAVAQMPYGDALRRLSERAGRELDAGVVARLDALHAA